MPATQPPKNKREMNWGRFSKTLAFWILILLIPVALIQLSGARSDSAPKINYTQFKEQLDRDNVKSVTVQAGKTITGDFRDRVPINNRMAPKFIVQLPIENSQGILDALEKHNVQISAEDARPSVMAWVINFLPWLLLIGFYLFLF